MICKQLIYDIKFSIKTYVDKHSSFKLIPLERKKDLQYINYLFDIRDPVVICRKLSDYLERIRTPFFSWVTFIDVNDFYWTIKSVLDKDEYLEINLLRSLIREKESALKECKKQLAFSQGEHYDNRLDGFLKEMKLMRNENQYLYKTIEDLNERILSLESKNNILPLPIMDNHKVQTVSDPNQIQPIIQVKVAQGKSYSLSC